MKIGIIGIGVVGGAIKYGFEKLGHKIVFHDVAYGTTIEDIVESEICFVCVPTPSYENGKCDTSVVKDVIFELDRLEYKGIVVIKSTVEPGTTEYLQTITNLRLCFVPEFLRERCAVSDFMENHDVCVIGTNDEDIYAKVKEAHGKYPKKFVQLSTTEAELCKYFNNLYNATLVTFANSFYEVCTFLGIDYTNVKNAVVNRSHITDIYLDCNDNIRGFAGGCLVKDTKAIAYLCENASIDVDFFKMLLAENSKYKATVFDGMRP